MSALVFMDTETCGLSLDDDIWEFAAIRRDEDGSEAELHMFLVHEGCHRLPPSFLADHLKRFPGACSGQVTDQVVAVRKIREFFGEDRPHVVGAVPNFDTERVFRLIRKWYDAEAKEPWHYHLIDVENLAVGYLAATNPESTDPDGKRLIVPPFDSDFLSFAVGVNADAFERHTAMGDVRWAMAIYDAVTGKAS